MGNGALRREIVRVARDAAARMTWPEELDRERAPELLHGWVRRHTRYVEEAEPQRVRYPAALLSERVGDCKSTAIFIASGLAAAGHAVQLRFIQQPDRPWYSHVYAYLPDRGAVDPLLGLYEETPYLRALDYTIPMRVQTVTGATIGAETLNLGAAYREADTKMRTTQPIDPRWKIYRDAWTFWRGYIQAKAPSGLSWEDQVKWADGVTIEKSGGSWVIKAFNDAGEHLSNIAQEVGEAVSNAAEFVWDGITKINPLLIAARAATLSLCRTNAGGLADKIAAKGVDKARRQWENLGGTFSHLQAAVTQGTGKPITGRGIGIAPIVVSSIVDAVAQDAASDAATEGANPAAPSHGQSLSALFKVAKPVIEAILSALGIHLGGNDPLREQLDNAAGSTSDGVQNQINDAPKKDNTALYIVGGIVIVGGALYLSNR